MRAAFFLLACTVYLVRPAASHAEEPKKGWGIQGLPIVNYNSDDQLGYGARVMFVNRGDGTAKPYVLAITAQFFQTTASVANHRLLFDAPAIAGSPWRVDGDVTLQIERFSPYYGLGNSSEYHPEYRRCEDRELLKQDPNTCPGNPDFRGLRYYAFEQTNLPRVALNVRRKLWGSWLGYGGYRFRWVTVRSQYSPADLGQARPSRLEEDGDAGLLVGYSGSGPDKHQYRTAELVLGVLFDSRDNEPAPNSGMFHELSTRLALQPFGSNFRYSGVTNNLRFYFPLIGGDRPLVGAFRLWHDVLWGDVPFTLKSVFGGLEVREAFGGLFTLRGLLKNRYLGNVKQVINAELRWTPLSGNFANQKLALTLIGGVDAGRVWTDLQLADGGGHKVTGVVGLRGAWNDNFEVRLDYGQAFTEASSGLYIDFSHLF